MAAPSNLAGVLLPPNVGGVALAVFANCNASQLSSNWQGATPSPRGYGCGINILRFLNEIDQPTFAQGLAHANYYSGTTAEVLAKYFNDKLKANFFYAGRPAVNAFTTRTSMESFYNTVKQALPDNTCIMMRLVGPNAGHWVLLSKERNELKTYDPILCPQGQTCPGKPYRGVSDNFFNAYKRAGYLTVEYVLVRPEGIPVRGGAQNEGETVRVVPISNKVLELCSGGKRRKTVRRTRRRRNTRR